MILGFKYFKIHIFTVTQFNSKDEKRPFDELQHPV